MKKSHLGGFFSWASGSAGRFKRLPDYLVTDYHEVITEPLYFSSTNFFTSGLW
ncbi:hypothetical protein FB597_105128 [Herbaspirillum sp. SJZ099]|nr:hypothetical protein FB597_105128 [Herbaspirillum sp. SJZ099]